MFRKGEVVKCINAGTNSKINTGTLYKVVEDQSVDDWVSVDAGTFGSRLYKSHRFRLAKREPQKETEGTYTIRLSSPTLLSYDRMLEETMVGDTKVAKVTVKVGGEPDCYLLLVRKDLLRKALSQEGGEEILKDLDELGVLPNGSVRAMSIGEWATAYGLVKKLLSLPLKRELKKDTVVKVEPLEV